MVGWASSAQSAYWEYVATPGNLDDEDCETALLTTRSNSAGKRALERAISEINEEARSATSPNRSFVKRRGAWDDLTRCRNERRRLPKQRV